MNVLGRSARGQKTCYSYLAWHKKGGAGYGLPGVVCTLFTPITTQKMV